MIELRVDKDAAHRLMARFLREHTKVAPAKVSELASQLTDQLVAAMPAPTRPGLRGWRMIPQYLPSDKRDDILDDVRSGFRRDVNYDELNGLWDIIYEYGRDVPADVVI
jgi:hypothetical protein